MTSADLLTILHTCSPVVPEQFPIAAVAPSPNQITLRIARTIELHLETCTRTKTIICRAPKRTLNFSRIAILAFLSFIIETQYPAEHPATAETDAQWVARQVAYNVSPAHWIIVNPNVEIHPLTNIEAASFHFPPGTRIKVAHDGRTARWFSAFLPPANQPHLVLNHTVLRSWNRETTRVGLLDRIRKDLAVRGLIIVSDPTDETIVPVALRDHTLLAKRVG